MMFFLRLQLNSLTLKYMVEIVEIKHSIFICRILSLFTYYFNFTLNQATACSRRLICLAFSSYWFQAVVINYFSNFLLFFSSSPRRFTPCFKPSIVNFYSFRNFISVLVFHLFEQDLIE